MAPKRKKVSTIAIRQSEAHYKNLFQKKVIEIAKAVSKNDGYKLLTGEMLDTIYQFRIRPFRVVTEENIGITSQDLKDIKESILTYIRRRALDVEGSEHKIEVYDFLGPGISLWYYIRNMRNTKAEVYPEIVKAFTNFIEDDNLFTGAMKIIHTITNFIGWDLTSFNKKLISIYVSVKSSEADPTCFYTEVKVKGYKPETIHVTFDGNTRPAFRLGITNNGSDVCWVNLDATSTGLHDLDPKTKIPVFIQHHAMSRLAERLDCVDNAMLLVNLVYSIDWPKYIEYKGRKLLEFNYFDQKIGYLMFDLTDGIIVLRTFLLLTHCSTPEGDNLHNMIGLEKHDISYLNLDKLSTFVLSDIRENQTLRDLFTRAGCLPLFETKKHDYDKECIVTKASTIESYFSKYQEHTKFLELPVMAMAQ
jgi:hypothetical protein